MFSLADVERVIVKFYYDDPAWLPQGSLRRKQKLFGSRQAEDVRVTSLPSKSFGRMSVQNMLAELLVQGYVLGPQYSHRESDGRYSTRFVFFLPRAEEVHDRALDWLATFRENQTWEVEGRFDSKNSSIRLKCTSPERV